MSKKLEQDVYIIERGSIDFDKVFTIAEVYIVDKNSIAISVSENNVEKLNKKFNCNIDPIHIQRFYAKDCGEGNIKNYVSHYIQMQIEESTGKWPKNIVQTGEKHKSQFSPGKECRGCLIMLPTSPKSIALKELPDDLKEKMDNVADKFNLKWNIKKGKK
jgi:hypothetical protein